MRAEIAAIERLLKSGKSKVLRNRTWDRICSENGVGQVIGKEIHLTLAEKQRLREYIESEYGVDPQFDSRAGGRMAMARHDASEKLSSDSVFGRLIVLATAGGASVRVSGEELRTPRGSVSSVLPECLDTDHLVNQNVVIIENGEVMPHWSELLLPEGWKDSVILYRGHRENVRSVAEIAKSHPAGKLAWFYDFDPAGLMLAICEGRGFILIPEQWRKLNAQTRFNQTKTHHNQIAALKNLKTRATGELRAITDHMESEGLALMQEHLIQRRVKLVALPVGTLK